MKYRTLGRTNFEVSEIAHGLWGMGDWTGSDDAQSLAALQLSVDLGCNFFDTAWSYGNGHSDELLGQILARNPGKRLYAASKIPPLNDKWPASAKYKYQDVFPTDHVFKYARLIRESWQLTPSIYCNSTFGMTAGPMSPTSARQSKN
jgi:aryl-alcohol dehydrogenase-like predicted oxidoreductase